MFMDKVKTTNIRNPQLKELGILNYVGQNFSVAIYVSNNFTTLASPKVGGASE